MAERTLSNPSYAAPSAPTYSDFEHAKCAVEAVRRAPREFIRDQLAPTSAASRPERQALWLNGLAGEGDYLKGMVHKRKQPPFSASNRTYRDQEASYTRTAAAHHPVNQSCPIRVWTCGHRHANQSCMLFVRPGIVYARIRFCSACSYMWYAWTENRDIIKSQLWFRSRSCYAKRIAPGLGNLRGPWRRPRPRHRARAE